MTYPHSHKTVIVLDRSPCFLESSKHQVEFDQFTKSRGPGIIPLAPICKSLWTCNVEAAVEYCRMVYDVYPLTSVIQLITSDKESRTVNNWDRSQQTLAHVMSTLALLGGPQRPDQGSGGDTNIIHGLTAAIEALCETTPLQAHYISEGEDEVQNNGRIIVLTQLGAGDSHLTVLEDCIQDALSQHSKMATSFGEGRLPISHLEVVIIHTVAVGTSSAVKHRVRRDVSGQLATEVHVTQSGTFVANKLVELCASHFSLASTTVTGIPMKEELNAASSANYDVELLHPADAHHELVRTGNADGLVVSSKEGLYLDTVTLKWCTPKSSSVDLHQTTGAFRVTPVDVNSRPSSCLTNFLLNGRSVMLEQPARKAGGAKVISHMLTSHGGELYIHVLATQRSCLEDPPSISEGCGGRVTDYRISDFGELMKESRLAPTPPPPAGLEGGRKTPPLERSKQQLERLTRYWPLVISDSVIFNMLPAIDPLHTLIVQPTLSHDQVVECKRAILHLVQMESRSEPLPSVPPSGSGRGKGPKREEQYRTMWAELERLVRAHAANSPAHAEVLTCLMDCKKPDAADTAATGRKIKDEKPDVSSSSIAEKAWQDYETKESLPASEKGDVKPDIKPDTAADSPPPLKKARALARVDLCVPPRGQPPVSLWTLWTSRIAALDAARCPEFSGRLDHGNKAPLYPQLKDGDEKEGDEKTTASGGPTTTSSSTGGLQKSASTASLGKQPLLKTPKVR